MAFKTIFTPLTRHEDGTPELDYAAALAEAQDAHLDVLCLGIDHTPSTYAEVGANAVVMQAAVQQAYQRAQEMHEAVEEELRVSGLRWEVRTGIAGSAGLGRTVAIEAQFADVAVVAQPAGDVEIRTVLEGLLFETDCPVIVVPEEGGNARPTDIVIGWNESAEAMRAVRAALPLLQAAKTVHIAIIDPPETGPERSDPGGALAVWLARFGVHCDIQVMTRQGMTVTERLCRHITDTGAQLLVMGGYGHSRFREALLGGATRDMLQSGPVPVLMAH